MSSKQPMQADGAASKTARSGETPGQEKSGGESQGGTGHGNFSGHLFVPQLMWGFRPWTVHSGSTQPKVDHHGDTTAEGTFRLKRDVSLAVRNPLRTAQIRTGKPSRQCKWRSV